MVNILGMMIWKQKIRNNDKLQAGNILQSFGKTTKRNDFCAADLPVLL